MSGPNTNYDPVEVTPLHAGEIERTTDEALQAFTAAADLAALQEAKLAHMSDRSPIALANREIGSLPPQARKEAGQRIGTARKAINEAFAARQLVLEAEHEERMLATERVDVTLPWHTPQLGARHPLSLISEQVADVFTALGWDVAEGPEVEAEWLNFDALNFQPDHPARQMQDTFFVEPAGSGTLLRTHTSPVQARSMLTRKPPIYVICPGRVFRTDELDATHTPVFHQVEGLVVDEGITLAHLKGTLDHFVTAMFGEGLEARIRPNYFPFTEPSAEVDLKCFVCRGESVGNPDRPCRTCGSEGWIEWGGCGVVNPRVLQACGIDTERYSGFAFGMGLERTLMFRNGVEDMRDMVEGDVRFSRQFGMEI
ncbi:phenylalanine--tRNA ligase subunit alpha [Kribbella sp. NBC_01245]|uniref:phenylalanine--tRNA ligase subunit alpha n=1 Tax=Kribbella sp. NBC_01245 TaxID=2903578 RepID=UPI002E27F88B|nr:phenylalanine--tRNA ligase subunit alpha [Kribbella sp. NBC_01245]